MGSAKGMDRSRARSCSKCGTRKDVFAIISPLGSFWGRMIMRKGRSSGSQGSHCGCVTLA
jgi:hypothetical protein